LKRNTIAFCIILLLIGTSVNAVDFGAILNGQFKVEQNDEISTSGVGSLVPWFSLPLGKTDLYVSAGISADYDEELLFIPELFRLEVSGKIASLAYRAGRIPWQDPSRFTAVGHFDGADVLFDVGKVQIGASAFYTGLLYKETADINFSPGDPIFYGEDFDWANFGDTYFAPRRVVMSLYGNFDGIPFQRGNLYAGLLAQFDCSDAEERFHTQYAVLRYTFDYKRFDLAAAAAIELENTEASGVKAAFAFSVEGGFNTGLLNDRLSLGVRWASGEGSATAAFFPITREDQGVVLLPAFSGIMVIRTQYQARLLPSLSAGIGARYFIRNDDTSFFDPDMENDSYLLGLEIDSELLWVPFSDFSLSLAIGIFLPQAGRAMRSDAPARWSLTLGTIFSF